jgi:hypothetical protein
MPEKRLRLIFAVVMFIAFLLPMNQRPDFVPVWGFIIVIVLELLLGSIFGPYIEKFFQGLLDISVVLGAPVMFLSNVWLAIHPNGVIKTLYRIYLLILLPFAWNGVFLLGPRWRGPGFWAIIVVLTAAVLLEIVFIARELRAKLENDGQ